MDQEGAGWLALALAGGQRETADTEWKSSEMV